jgi:hypothetical protein
VRERAGGVDEEPDPQVSRWGFTVWGWGAWNRRRRNGDEPFVFVVVQFRAEAALAGAALRGAVEVGDQGCEDA